MLIAKLMENGWMLWKKRFRRVSVVGQFSTKTTDNFPKAKVLQFYIPFYNQNDTFPLRNDTILLYTILFLPHDVYSYLLQKFLV